MTGRGEELEAVARAAGERRVRERRAYAPPRLAVLGEIRTLTVGPSNGTGESAGPEVRYLNTLPP